VPVTAIVGAQWGDEGKGKITDLLAQEADLVIRYQGGNNAGHTVVNERGTFKLHLVPSGIFNPNATCILGTGMVIDLAFLCAELRGLEARGVSTANLRISDRAHLLMPWHIAFDRLDERERGRITLLDDALCIEHHHPAGQRFQQQSQTICQAFFFGELQQPFTARGGEFLSEARDLMLKIAIRRFQLQRHPVEDIKSVFQLPVATGRLLAHGKAAPVNTLG